MSYFARISVIPLNGLELSFTDATLTHQGVFFSAAAEASPNVTSDGIVSGSVLGILDAHPRWIELCTSDEALFKGKVEGICVSKQCGQKIFAVIDADDSGLPCELCEIELLGAW